MMNGCFSALSLGCVLEVQILNFELHHLGNVICAEASLKCAQGRGAGLEMHLKGLLSVNYKNVVAAIVGHDAMADEVVQVVLVNRVSLAEKIDY